MTFTEEIHSTLFSEKELRVFVLRLDRFRPEIGGNKYFKLKYNLQKAKEQNHHTLLSFGGAFSNHIAALAAAGKEFGFRTIGVIRGEELNPDSNPTLKLASQNGMHLHFVSREQYALKENETFIGKLKAELGDFFLVPEGGSNAHALKGCMEIKDLISFDFNCLLTACGTGGTIAGISLSLTEGQKVIGIPVLKGAEFLKSDVIKLKQLYFEEYGLKEEKDNIEFEFDYHFGGYAKTTTELLNFKTTFEKETGIPTDRIYTAKMFYALYDLVKKDRFPKGSTIVAIHTGGLQGELIHEQNI